MRHRKSALEVHRPSAATIADPRAALALVESGFQKLQAEATTLLPVTEGILIHALLRREWGDTYEAYKLQDYTWSGWHYHDAINGVSYSTEEPQAPSIIDRQSVAVPLHVLSFGQPINSPILAAGRCDCGVVLYSMMVPPEAMRRFVHDLNVYFGIPP